METAAAAAAVRRSRRLGFLDRVMAMLYFRSLTFCFV